MDRDDILWMGLRLDNKEIIKVWWRSGSFKMSK